MRFGEDNVYCSCSVIWAGGNYRPVTQKRSSCEIEHGPLLREEGSSCLQIVQEKISFL